MSSLVSVVMPAYNHEKFIEYAIISIVNQTYKNIELLIIDDGSTDKTFDKIKNMHHRYKSRFVRFCYYRKNNEGTSKTLNRLIELSQGEYIYIIASDDMSKPQAIEKEIHFLSNNLEFALVVGDNEIIDDKNLRCFWDCKRNIVYDNKEAKYFTFKDFLQKKSNINFNSTLFGTYRTLRRGNYIPNGYMIVKSIFNKTGMYSTKAPLEDYYMVMQISKFAKMKFLDEILFSYRWHKANTVKKSKLMKKYSQLTKKYDVEKNAYLISEQKLFLNNVRRYIYYMQIKEKIFEFFKNLLT